MTQPMVAMVLFGLEGGSLVEKCSPRVLGQNSSQFCDGFHTVDFQNDPQTKSGNLPGKSLLEVHQTAIHGSLNHRHRSCGSARIRSPLSSKGQQVFLRPWGSFAPPC